MASIRKRGDKWQARIQRSGYPDIAKSFSNRIDADRWGRITESEIDRGVYESRIELEKTTLNDVLVRYKTEITPTKKGVKQEGYTLGILMRDPLSKLSLAQIRSIDIARYRDKRIETVAANTVKNELNTLSAVFEACRMEWSLNISNPVRGLIVSVDRSIEPKHGHIVVAVIHNEFTLKRLYRKRGVVELHPDNPAYEPIRLKDCEELQVWAVATGVVRKFKV